MQLSFMKNYDISEKRRRNYEIVKAAERTPKWGEAQHSGASILSGESHGGSLKSSTELAKVLATQQHERERKGDVTQI